jgi:hypothetical protein
VAVSRDESHIAVGSAPSAQLLAELEAAAHALSTETWERERDWCVERFDELYGGGIEAFGLTGPTAEELLEAGLWFLLDCPLPDGQTPLWRRRQSDPGRAVELLGRSELRAWRVEAVVESGGLVGLCPLGSGRARLEPARSPVGELQPGAMIVARSVPLGPERWALLGRIPVVEQAAAADFDALLASLDAPRGEFWRVHGGVLSHAAWTWPELRQCTADGVVVRDSHLIVEVDDPARLLAALDGDPELVRVPAGPGEHAPSWQWRWDPPSRREPADGSPGVSLSICPEDADPHPYLATVTLDAGHRDLFCLAPTPERLGLVRQLLEHRFGATLGAAGHVRVEPPEAMPRWKRLRLAGVFSAHRAAFAA